MSVRDTFKAFKKAIKSYETEGTNSALELAFFDVKNRILEDVETRIERLEELEKTQTGREYASTRFLEIVGTNIKDQGGFGGNADATETVSFTIADRAQSIIDAATEFEKQAAILDKDIKLHRRETAVIQGEALTNKEWKTWIDKRAKELGMGPRIFWQPASLAMDVNELQQRLKETVAEVNKEKETAKGLVSEAIQLRNFEDRLIEVVDNGVQPVQIFDVLSDKTKTEVQQRIERGMKNSKSEISDAPPALQLIFRGINDSPAIPADEGMRREPLPGELDRDDLVSGADDLTESERIREGLDTVVEPEEMVPEDEVFADIDAGSFDKYQPVISEDPDPDPNGGGGGDDDDANKNKGSQLTDSAMEYISENFGSVEFFLQRDDLEVTKDGVTKNVIKWIIDDEEENPDVIWSLFQQTKWFAENGPSARQFQSDWFRAGGTDEWTPNYDPSDGWLGMKPGMLELLDDTYDSLILEAERIGIDTNQVKVKNAVMGMAYNAKQLNMTDYEMKNEFLINVNLAFDPNAVKGSGTFGAIRQKLQSNAATYMLKLDDTSLDQFAQDIYLGKATYEGINAGFATSAKDMNPAIASLIDQGYTPSAYFASYGNVASNLLGRPVDFLGGDSKMFSALTDTMVSGDGLGRPMTRGEFERYVRATPEWDTSINARDEAYSTVDTLLNSFGVRV